VLVEPAVGTDDGAVAVDWFFASRNGERVAFGLSEGGSDNSTLFVVNSTDGSRLAEQIPSCRAVSLAWEPDGSGFFYTCYPEDRAGHGVGKPVRKRTAEQADVLAFLNQQLGTVSSV
jgi:prolyl oligopeptidase